MRRPVLKQKETTGQSPFPRLLFTWVPVTGYLGFRCVHVFPESTLIILFSRKLGLVQNVA